METKLFEVRDRMTLIVCVGVRMTAVDPKEALMLGRCGYGPANPSVLFTRADGGAKAFVDPYDFGDRTMVVAHNYVTENWDTLQSGAVVDVEFILNETKEAKQSEFPL